MKKNIVLIGAADSIGVPYSRDNKQHIGFFEMIEEYLATSYEVTTINCFHMSTNNDNRYINYLLSNEVSLESIKDSQNKMLKRCKYSGIYPYLELPKKFLNHYQKNHDDQHIIVKESIEKNKTIFIYSAFVNDLLKAQNLSLFKLLFPGRIKKEIKKINLDQAIADLEDNIETLISLNPQIEIYLISLFIPTKIPFIRDNLEKITLFLNYQLFVISQKYSNVYFVDNTYLPEESFNNIDFHPNQKGHIKIYQNFLREYQKNKK